MHCWLAIHSFRQRVSWKRFVDNTLATAMIDRLMHHGEAMVIQGNSFRTKGDNPDDTKGDHPDQ